MSYLSAQYTNNHEISHSQQLNDDLLISIPSGQNIRLHDVVTLGKLSNGHNDMQKIKPNLNVGIRPVLFEMVKSDYGDIGRLLQRSIVHVKSSRSVDSISSEKLSVSSSVESLGSVSNNEPKDADGHDIKPSSIPNKLNVNDNRILDSHGLLGLNFDGNGTDLNVTERLNDLLGLNTSKDNSDGVLQSNLDNSEVLFSSSTTSLQDYHQLKPKDGLENTETNTKQLQQAAIYDRNLDASMKSGKAFSMTSLASGSSTKKKKKAILKDLLNKQNSQISSNTWLLNMKFMSDSRIAEVWTEHLHEIFQILPKNEAKKFLVPLVDTNSEAGTASMMDSDALSKSTPSRLRQFFVSKKESYASMHSSITGSKGRVDAKNQKHGIGMMTLMLFCGHDWILGDLNNFSEPWARLSFKSLPTCQDVLNSSPNIKSEENGTEILLGFNDGEIIYINPLKKKYLRFNKEGFYHKQCVTKVSWMPAFSGSFVACFADGIIMVMSIECEDTSYYRSSKGLHKDLTSSSLNIDDLDKEDLAEMEVDAKMLSEAAKIQTSFCNSSIQCFLQLIHKSKRQTRNPLTVWRLYSPGRPVPFGVEVQDGIVSDENELYLKLKPLNKCASPVITGIQFSPTNPMLMALTTSSGGVFFVDLEVQSEAQNSSILFNLLSVYYISCGAALCGKFSSDGFVFAVGGHDDLVTLIDVEACLNGYGSFSGVLLEGHDNWVNDLHIESFKATDTIKGKANSSQHGFSTERFKTVYKIWSVGEDGKFCTFEVDRRKVLRKRNNMQSQNSWASLDRTLPREAGDLRWKSLDRSIATRICSPNMQTAVKISAQTSVYIHKDPIVSIDIKRGYMITGGRSGVMKLWRIEE